MNKNIKYLVEEYHLNFIGADIVSGVDDTELDVIRSYAFYKPNNSTELREHIKEKLSKGVTNFNYIDVSELTEFNYVFTGLDPGEIDISEWKVSQGEYFIRMFSGCKRFNCDLSKWKLDNAINCFEMFCECESLTSVPLLSNEELAGPILFNKHNTPYEYPTGCYESMFYRCKLLSTPPKLPAATLTPYCYSLMFYGCDSLVNGPELPALEIALSCYSYMFSYCIHLEKAPKLPATNLEPQCYFGMFNECSSLVEPPELPATKLAPNCYNSMFLNCLSLTASPVLPALETVLGCYENMFNGCNSLSYIKMMATDYWYVSASNDMVNWVKNVALNGIFVINKLLRNGLETECIKDENRVPIFWKIKRE